MTPDSWAYWEGSVSLLYGNGYRHFGGATLLSTWPPLFSTLLCVTQAAFGVSTRALAHTLCILTGLAAASWTLLFLTMTEGKGSLLAAGFEAVYFSCFLAANSRYLLSEQLWLVLLPLLLAAIGAPPGKALTARRIGVIGFLFLLLLLTRDVSVTLIPPLAAAEWVAWVAIDRRRRTIAVGVSVLAPLMVWVGFMAVFGGLGGHSLQLGASSVLADVENLARNLSYLIGPDRLGIGATVLLGILIVILVASSGRRNDDDRRSAPVTPLVHFTWLSVVCLVGLFYSTPIGSRLEGRFIWYLPLLLATVIGLVAVTEQRRWLRWLAVALLVAMVTVQARRTALFVHLAQTGRLKGVPLNLTIRPDYNSKPPMKLDGQLLVSPPTYRWMKRTSLRPQESTSQEPKNYAP